MAGVYDDIDVEFGWNGDFALDETGDLKVNTDDTLSSIVDQIHNICASMFSDWEVYPNRAAGLDDYMGEPNTRETGKLIENRIKISLVSAEIVEQDDLDVRVIPIHANKVLIVIKVNAAPTSFNNLRPEEPLQVSLVFDSAEQQVFFLDKTPDILG